MITMQKFRDLLSNVPDAAQHFPATGTATCFINETEL